MKLQKFPWRRQLADLSVVTIMFLAVSNSAIAQLPDPPAWWQMEPAIIISGAESSNQGPVNLGQVKFVAMRALDALEPIDPALAAAIRNDLVGPDKIIPSFAAPVTAAEKESQHLMGTIGQLKAIAKPFYDHLNRLNSNQVLDQLNENGLTEVGQDYWQIGDNVPADIGSYTANGYYPWNPTTPIIENKSPATIGQLKVLFALKFSQIVSLSEMDSDGDGVSDVNEELVGTDPNKQDNPLVGLKVFQPAK